MKPDSLKIGLFMIPPLTQGGGAEKYFINLAREFSLNKAPTDIITMDDHFFSGFARLIHIIYHLNFFKPINLKGRETQQSVESKLKPGKWIQSSFKSLKTVLNQYDVIYVKNEIPELLLLKVLGYQHLPPLIIGVHTPIQFPLTGSLYSKIHNFLYGSFFYKFLLQNASCIHASNKFTYNFITQKFGLLARLIYYPFSLSAKKPDKPLSSNLVSTFETNKTHISFYGRLSEQKGPDVISRLVNYVEQSGIDIQSICLHLFGSGDEFIETMFLNLTKNHPWVLFHHHIENKYIIEILKKTQFVLAPSKWEVLPFNLLEAQAAGVPVIAFDIPGSQDIIIHEKTGLLAKDEKELYSLFVKAITNKYKFDKQEIKRNIHNKFNPQTINKQLLTMFKTYAKI